jgi:PAS domain S-box-containing protein
MLWVAAVLGSAAGAATPQVAAGKLDLGGWDFVQNGPVHLDGPWAFDRGRFLDPAAPGPLRGFHAVPAPWNDAAGGGRGHATYRLQVACSSTQGLALSLPFQHTALAVYANGELLARQGQPGATPQSHQPALSHQRVPLTGLACPLNLLVHVSNHEVFRGGLVRSLQVGTEQQLQQAREGALGRALLALGSVLVVALLSLIFFYWRPRDRTALYFGLFCLSFGISLGLSGERPLQPYVSGLGFEGQFKLVFGSWFGALAAFPLFLGSLYREVSRLAVRACVVFALGGVLLVMATPISVFSYTAPVLQFAATAVAAYLAVALAVAWWRGRPGAGILLVGLLVLIATSAHDVVFFQHLLTVSLAPFGVLGFVLAPALLLARRFSRALAAEELRAIEQSERADLLVRSTKAGVLDWDAVSGTVTHSERYREMLGYPAGPGAPEPPPFRELVHPQDHDKVHGSFLRQLRDRSCRNGVRGGEPMDYRMRRAGGGEIWVHAEAISLCGSDGRMLRYICSFIDITRTREQQEALRVQVELTRLEQQRLELVVRAAKAGIVDFDAIARTAYYSPRLREMLGYAPDADTSSWPDYFEMIHPEDRGRVAAEFRKHIVVKRVPGELAYHDRIEYRLRRADGSWVWVQGMGVSTADEQGRTAQFIASITDISERRAQEERLRAQAALLEQQNEALKENVRLREEVERIGRHDIKTPLNSIVAVPRLLREERRLGPEADELLGIVERAGYRILSMVNLSLDLYKMEQGGYVFRPDAVDLADLVGKVIADVRMHAASKQVRVVVQVQDAPYAWAEELLCYSLVANLLKNAVEASPEGGVVTVTASPAPEESVLLRIHNHGVVPEELRATFFQKYATMGKASGTGLGTYSARLMARVQDGDIDMQTSAQAGTTLTVRLRAAPAGKVPATLRHAAERRGVEPGRIAAMPPLRVLLVDDDEYNLLIVRRFLPTPPFTVDTAINGKVALAAAELQWPDVIFMDLDMPVMGGLQAVQALRALERATLARRCTMVALSSHEDEDTRQRSLAAGFDRYLTKPVTREIIHETLLELDTLIGPGCRPDVLPAPARPPAARMEDPVIADPDVEPVLAEFVASRRQLIADMCQAMALGHRGEVRRIAHQLAGSFGLYGFHWASERSRWVEKNFSELEADQLSDLADQLQQHLETVEIRWDGGDS